MSKIKGTRAERELFHMLWQSFGACVRIAGSGSTTKPAPDLLAGNKNYFLAIECKAVKGDAKYLSDEDVAQLLIFAEQFGAEPWLAVRFDNKGWFFLDARTLEKSKGKSFVVSYAHVQEKGLVFDTFVKKYTMAIQKVVE